MRMFLMTLGTLLLLTAVVVGQEVELAEPAAAEVATDSQMLGVADLSDQVDENTKQILALQENQQTIQANQTDLADRVAALEEGKPAPAVGMSLGGFERTRFVPIVRASRLAAPNEVAIDVPPQPQTLPQQLPRIVSGGGSTGGGSTGRITYATTTRAFGSPVSTPGFGSTGGASFPALSTAWASYTPAPTPVYTPQVPRQPLPLFMPAPAPVPTPRRYVPTQTTSQLVRQPVYKNTTTSLSNCPGGVCPVPASGLGSRLRSRRPVFLK